MFCIFLFCLLVFFFYYDLLLSLFLLLSFSLFFFACILLVFNNFPCLYVVFIFLLCNVKPFFIVPRSTSAFCFSILYLLAFHLVVLMAHQLVHLLILLPVSQLLLPLPSIFHHFHCHIGNYVVLYRL